MIIFHHNDNDGLASAAIVNKFTQISTEDLDDRKVFVEMDYHKRFPIEEIKKDECVYIVDFSIHPEEMIELLKITSNVVWIDHHISAIEKYNKYFKDKAELQLIQGIREDGVAGCELTWKWFSEKPLPTAIRLIAENDVYKFTDKEKAMEFKAGFSLFENKNDFTDKDVVDAWNWLLKNGSIVDTCIEYGEIVLRSKRNGYKYTCKECGFECSLNGYKAFAVNSPNMSSDDFVDVDASKYDLLISYYFNGQLFKYSLREGNKKVACNKIAESYGGGGHVGAAGFTSNEFVLKTEKSIPMSDTYIVNNSKNK